MTNVIVAFATEEQCARCAAALEAGGIAVLSLIHIWAGKDRLASQFVKKAFLTNWWAVTE